VTYEDFLAAKAVAAPATGIKKIPTLSRHLFPFQRDIVRWALLRGRAAIFADCGLGKTLMQLEWAKHVPGRVLILTPLAVAQQTVREGEKFGIPAVYARHGADSGAKITVANYEMLEHFDPSNFDGVVLDESSILKSYDGATRTRIIEAFNGTRFRLACTATPAPNDFMELGNHAEFLDAMTRAEMLAMFFVHDGGETQQWRLKGHAERDFWRWVCSWAVSLRTPSDLGYDDAGFNLPPLRYHDRIVPSPPSDGQLFAMQARSLVERLGARRASVDARVAECAQLVNKTPGSWVVWCHLNAESEALTRAIPGAVEIRGSDDSDHKAQAMLDFAASKIRVLVTKPRIAGFGMNWQHCHRMAFVGLSDSYEQFYQAVRRCWRFGQKSPVDAYCISAETEGAVAANLKRKDADADRMARAMVAHMHDLNEAALKGTERTRSAYTEDVAEGDGWTIYLGDCVEVVRRVPDSSIHFTVFSPPFASLYTYSNSERDMGNVKDDEEFAKHFGFLVGDLYRVTMPGRLCAFHCMNLPTSKVRDGVIGLKDFRGDLIRAFESEGWIYHSEVCIWKDPVTQMQRTKALGLLHKQIKKDSSMSRQGLADYLVVMRKPGDNPEPVTHTNETFPVQLWQRFASPVWMDIDPSDTLQYRSAREHADDRHICPLQLEVIRRAIRLWSNPGDTVLSPFAGIGSEGYVALEEERRFIGVELKASYWRQACKNMENAKASRAMDLFTETAK
jgi:hypothetical protein